MPRKPSAALGSASMTTTASFCVTRTLVGAVAITTSASLTNRIVAVAGGVATPAGLIALTEIVFAPDSKIKPSGS